LKRGIKGDLMAFQNAKMLQNMVFFVECSRMKKGNNRNRYFTWTSTALLLLVLVHPIFHEYQDLTHSDFFPSFKHIEGFHPDDLSITRDDHHYPGDMVISALPGAISETVGSFCYSPNFLSSNFYLDQQDLILRC
jgi:hypothetical protein